MKLTRRNAIAWGVAAPAAFGQTGAIGQPPALRAEPNRGSRQGLDLVKAFVVAGHSDRNVPKLKDMIAKDPKLVYAAWDWGGGDWETALGGAGHIGSRDAARLLLDKGARIDAFCAAMLGERGVVAALVAASPAVVGARGPHGYTLLYHAAISGDVAMAELLKPHLDDGPKAYTQAVSAAVRGSHL